MLRLSIINQGFYEISLDRAILLKISNIVPLTSMVKELTKMRVKLETIYSLPLHEFQIAWDA